MCCIAVENFVGDLGEFFLGGYLLSQTFKRLENFSVVAGHHLNWRLFAMSAGKVFVVSMVVIEPIKL
jgi:hypothetical protein